MRMYIAMYVLIAPFILQCFYHCSVMKPLVESYPQYAEFGDLKDITPLHWASYHGNYEVARLLLEKVKIHISVYNAY